MKRIFSIFLACIFCKNLIACNPQDFLSYFPFFDDRNESKKAQVYSLSIDPVYLAYIIGGEKTSEGRLNLPDFATMVPGDLIVFYDDQGNTAVCTVNRITRYPTFERMLVSEGVYNMLPQIDPATNSFAEMIAKGVVVYNSFPGYKEGVKVLGAIAFTLRYDGSDLPESYSRIDVIENEP